MSHEVVPWYTTRMEEYENPNTLVQSTLQLCFCGDKATPLALEPLNAHNPGCLVWDWALANRKHSARARMLQLDHYGKTIGDPGGETDADPGPGTGDPVATGDDGNGSESAGGDVRGE
jgi:hypothetical protein